MTIHSIKVMNWPGRAVTFFEGLFHMYLKTYEPEVHQNLETSFKIVASSFEADISTGSSLERLM